MTSGKKQTSEGGFIKILKENTLFAGINEADILSAIMLMSGKRALYEKGGIIHLAGEAMDKFGILLSGVVHVCADDMDGNPMIMAEVTAGGTFGESICYLKIKESPVYIISTEAAEVLWLDPEPLMTGGDELAEKLLANFISLLAKRTLTMNSRIQILSKRSLRQKLMTFFSEYRRKFGTTFSVPFDRNDMAVFLGTDRSALSRELSKMKNEGIIDYYKNTFRLLNK